MSKIKINEVKDISCDLYDDEGVFVGIITNILKFNDVRIQISKQKLTGCYIVFNGNKIDIDKNGELRDYPNGLFDTITQQYIDLMEMKDRNISENTEHECGPFCDPIDCPNHGRKNK